MRIKIIKTYPAISTDDQTLKALCMETEWQQISTEDYDFLKANINRVHPYAYSGYHILVYEDVNEILLSLKKAVTKEQKEQERLLKEKQKKAAEKEKRKQEKELKMLKTLQEKHADQLC